MNIDNALKIGGWMSETELQWLAREASRYTAIVEFGSYHGRSTRALGDNTKGVVFAVDPWNGDYFQENGANMEVVNTYALPAFKNNLRDLIEKGIVVPRRGFSYNFKPPYPVDMVFIDGDHRYETVIKDIKHALTISKPGALISGHDYGHPTWPGVEKATKELFDNVSVVDTIWWTIKS